MARFTDKRTWHTADLDIPYKDAWKAGRPVNPTKPAPPERANLISSLLDSGLHAPALDLDGLGARLVPSSTEGNFHLYLDDLHLSWPRYRFLLWALMVSGVIQRGFYKASVARRMSTLRPPWVKKTKPEAF